MLTHYKRFSIASILFLLAFLPCRMFSQCSNEALTAKYWQYRDNLNKHFVLTDRDPSGCVNDGIGQDPNDPCIMTKHGYSLPATSINQASDGGHGMLDRNWQYINDDPANGPNPFYDQDCGGHTCFEGNPSMCTKNNFLDMGSETPHQMGWYWVTLASEYVLLKLSGQLAEAQRTLEELFLGLQAYRRLDITANCMARERYQEITVGFEAIDQCWPLFPPNSIPKPCLCGNKYKGESAWHFDSPCRTDCIYTPNTSGYSGFFIREDGTPELEMLHDDSEDKWNIDGVQSGYAMSLKPPCTTSFSPACYNVYKANFMSQDGVFGLMMGLAMIKQLIPPHATVTTCDGTTYEPHQMAITIASNLTNRIDNTYSDRISWPESYNCCDKEVFFSEENGGRVIASMVGLKRATSYIDGAERHNDVAELIAWRGLTEQTRKLVHGEAIIPPPLQGLHPTLDLLLNDPNIDFGDNANFWIRLKTLGWDMGGAVNNTLYQDAIDAKHLEIMRIINNLLYPSDPNLGLDKDYFKRLLCDAPCGGPCKKRQDYPTNSSTMPNYDCPNTPNWVGQRWESHHEDSGTNRQFNGLDYMALYNLFMLHFPEERTLFYNPERPSISEEHFLGESAIEGPTILCPGQVATYTLKSTYPSATIDPLKWESSDHFTLSTDIDNPTDATFAFPAAQGYRFISAEFKENRLALQYYTTPSPLGFGGSSLLPIGENSVPYTPITDVCEFTYRKAIGSAAIPYTITAVIDHCTQDYWFTAIGPNALIYNWQIIADPDNPNLQNVTVYGPPGYASSTLNLTHPHFPGTSGMLTINLTVVNFCDEFYATLTVPYTCSYPNMRVRADPNPATTTIGVHVTRDEEDYVMLASGMDVRITNTNNNAIDLNTKIYSNGQSIDVTTLPSGTYNLQVTDIDVAPTNTTFIIAR